MIENPSLLTRRQFLGMVGVTGAAIAIGTAGVELATTIANMGPEQLEVFPPFAKFLEIFNQFPDQGKYLSQLQEVIQLVNKSKLPNDLLGCEFTQDPDGFSMRLYSEQRKLDMSQIPWNRSKVNLAEDVYWNYNREYIINFDIAQTVYIESYFTTRSNFPVKCESTIERRYNKNTKSLVSSKHSYYHQGGEILAKDILPGELFVKISDLYRKALIK